MRLETNRIRKAEKFTNTQSVLAEKPFTPGKNGECAVGHRVCTFDGSAWCHLFCLFVCFSEFCVDILPVRLGLIKTTH